jgi:hypothetical protein
MFTVEFNSLITAWVYGIIACLLPSTYLYVQVRTGIELMYQYVPGCTGTDQYILVRTVWPDPVHVSRIPGDNKSFVVFYHQ